MKNLTQFKKIDEKDEAKIYGGMAVSTGLAIGTFIITGIKAIASMVKMFTSKKGKVTSNGIEWDNKDPITNQPIKTTPVFISY